MCVCVCVCAHARVCMRECVSMVHPVPLFSLSNAAPSSKCPFSLIVQVENLIAIQLAYVNTNHPDFVGGTAVLSELVGKEVRSLYPCQFTCKSSHASHPDDFFPFVHLHHLKTEDSKSFFFLLTVMLVPYTGLSLLPSPSFSFLVFFFLSLHGYKLQAEYFFRCCVARL